jgi:hypothetical protein
LGASQWNGTDGNLQLKNNANTTIFTISAPDFGGSESITVENTGGGTTGFEEILDNNILIYPNPAQNEITIDASNASIDYDRILITDITGKIIFETAVGGNKITAINLGSFANGIYNARIVSKSGITVKQFSKK